MAKKFTNAFLDALLAAAKNEFSGNCVMQVYSGPVPENSHDAASGATLLITYSDNASGDPLEFEDPADGILPKASTQLWRGVAVANGSPTFFRFVQPGDMGNDAVDQSVVMRWQGTAGVVNSNWNTNKVFENGNSDTLENFFLAFAQ